MKRTKKGHKGVIFAALLAGLLYFLIVQLWNGTTPMRKIIYTVEAGDTLWSIAEEYKPRNYDMRRYIFDIEKMNNLENCDIHTGMQIEIITEKGR